MRYYSDVVNKVFSTEEELNQAEKAYAAEQAAKIAEQKRKEAEKKALTDARKARAAEVDEARKKMIEAQKEYKRVLQAFCKDYNGYHFTSTKVDDFPSFIDLFEGWF